MSTLESQIPSICGDEEAIAATMANTGPVALPNSDIDFGKARAAFAIALHMHQPLIPAGGDAVDSGQPTRRLWCDFR